jgi:diketogulonate reductase-like aldo/keto reductase
MLVRRKFLQLMGSAALATVVSPAVNAGGREALPRRVIPGTQESLAVIGLGNSQAFREGDMVMSRQLIKLFLEHGGSYIDTGSSAREIVGKIMRENDAHDELFLGTYLDGEDLPSMRTEIRQLLKGQGGDSLDLVQTRSPEIFRRRHNEFAALKEQGLTRFLGVARSNERYYPALMSLMKDGIVDFVQLNYSIMEPGAANEILPLAQETGTAIVINRPFLNGNYFDIVRGHTLPAWAAEFDCSSWAQFSLKYILAHPAVNCVLTETANPKHAIDNLGAGHGRLPDAGERQRMEGAIRALM